jgi:hypothetical protein
MSAGSSQQGRDEGNNGNATGAPRMPLACPGDGDGTGTGTGKGLNGR